MEIKSPTQSKIWGLDYEELTIDGDLWWKISIRSPFYHQGKGWLIGLNEKILWKARQQGVKKFILQVDNTEQLMDIPDKKYLQSLEEQGEFQDIPSKFENGKPMRVYWFKFNPTNKNSKVEKQQTLIK